MPPNVRQMECTVMPPNVCQMECTVMPVPQRHVTGRFTDVVVSMVVLMSVLRCTSPDGSTKRWPASRGGQHGRADADASAARRRTDHRREGQHGHADVGASAASHRTDHRRDGQHGHADAGVLRHVAGRISDVMVSMVAVMSVLRC